VSRLRRFEEYRFVGTRDTMRVYDCDDEDQFSRLEERASAEDLLNRKLLQAFSPDTVDEARNRGFKPVVSSE
jgi:hypothetical protein